MLYSGSKQGIRLCKALVDAENRLVGIVTIDDAISILQDEASEDIAKMNAIGPADKPYFKQSMSGGPVRHPRAGHRR